MYEEILTHQKFALRRLLKALQSLHPDIPERKRARRIVQAALSLTNEQPPDFASLSLWKVKGGSPGKKLDVCYMLARSEQECTHYLSSESDEDDWVLHSIEGLKGSVHDATQGQYWLEQVIFAIGFAAATIREMLENLPEAQHAIDTAEMAWMLSDVYDYAYCDDPDYDVWQVNTPTGDPFYVLAYNRQECWSFARHMGCSEARVRGVKGILFIVPIDIQILQFDEG